MARNLRCEPRGGVVEITLDRPPANAIDRSVSGELYEAFCCFRDDPALRVAILTGGGRRFFSAGWDLKAGEAVDDDHGPGGFAGLTELFDLPKPVIAAVGGLAVGGGFELALACDLVVAADYTEFSLPEVTLGIVADAGGILRLPRRLPRVVANRLLLTGERLGAAEALRLGLVNEVVPGDELMASARALADRIAGNAPLAVQATLEVLRATETLSVEEGFEALRSGRIEAYQRMLRSEDAREGPRAVAEKRQPQWVGR